LEKEATAKKFGTLMGVFIPNVLTILGLVLFLRLSWVVGQAGLIHALIIIVLANMITFLTGLSMSAISTSMDVKAGGTYYIISRSLGLEIGGAIGITLYLSQAISVAFYIIGCTEALSTMPFFSGISKLMIGVIILTIFAIMAFIGANFVTKIQSIIFVVMMASILSFFFGGWGEIIAPNLVPSYTSGYSFWLVFAIFFPAVTGITVGASMSGDLKDPSKSIPKGTMAAIILTFFIYFFTAIWFSLHATSAELISNTMMMQEISLFPILILMGLIFSTLSQSLSSMMAAPRTLQAIAEDTVVPKFLSHKMGSKTEPRAGVILTFFIALSILLIGEINVVAPIISMFFLNTYGMINLVTLLEHLVNNPAYRPKLKIHWLFNLIGLIGCYGAMFLINAKATIVAILVSFFIYSYLTHKSLNKTWGDIRTGVWQSLSHFSIYKLENKFRGIKNWRPNIVIFTSNKSERENFLDLAMMLNLGRGFVTFIDFAKDKESQKIKLDHVKESFSKKKIFNVFYEVEITDDVDKSIPLVSQAHGLGSLYPNTIMFWFHRNQEKRLLDMVKVLNALDKSVILFQGQEKHDYINISLIRTGEGHNMKLMLLMAHLFVKNNKKCKLTVVVRNDAVSKDTKALLDEMRIEAKIKIDPELKMSKESDLVIVGLPNKDKTKFLKKISIPKDTAVMIISGSGIDKIVGI